MWAEILRETKTQRIKKISVTLYALTPSNSVQPDLFASLDTRKEKKREKNEKISQAMDVLNQKFGKDTVMVGMTAEQGKAFTGAKIAFTRIPDIEEFVE